jgi:hypothetical protein
MEEEKNSEINADFILEWFKAQVEEKNNLTLIYG